MNIEDSEADQALILRQIGRAGFEMTARRIETEEEMRAALLAETYWDVILCDYSLPRFDAPTALAVLKELDLDIPFIIISGTIGEEAAVNAMRSGAHDYFVKDNLALLAPAIEREVKEAENRRVRRQAEESLRESEARYRDLVEHSKDLICTHDLGGRVISVNQAAEKILGYPASQMIGLNLRAIIPGEFHKLFDNYLNEIREKGIAEGIMTVRRRDGEKRIWEYSNTLRTTGVAVPVVRGTAHDVTEHFLAERALKASEAELRAIFEAMTDTFLVVNSEGRILKTAPKKTSMYCLPTENAVGKTLHEIYPTEKADFFLEKIKRTLVEGKTLKVEYNLLIDGEEKWFEAYASPMTEESVVWVARDRTERRRVTEELAKSEERYRLLFINNPVPMWVYDIETLDFLDVNDAAIGSYGFTKEEFLSKTILDIRPEEEVPALLRYLAGKQDGSERIRFWKHRKKDGTVIDVEIISHTFVVAGKKAELVLANDVTEQRRIGEIQERRAAHMALRADISAALAESTASLKEVLEKCAEVLVQHLEVALAHVWTLNKEEDVLELQASASTRSLNAAREISFEMEKISPGDDKYLAYITNDAQNDPRVLDKNWAEREGMTAFAEYPLTLEGKPLGKIAIFAREKLPEDTLDAMYSIADIISQGIERKRTEEALRQSEELLSQSQKLEAIGQLAGGIAHDFNNLLTAINGYSELSWRMLRDEDPIRRNLEEIKKAGERAAALTRQLLAFSRRQVLQPKALDLNAVVSDLEKMLTRLIGEDIDLQAALDSKLGSVQADPGQIEQVIMNLVVNARDAMPGGGKLTIETANVYLDKNYVAPLNSIAPGHYVMLAVSDTGMGMDEETIQRIFEPFFTTKEVGKGTGLGLATVYGIVKQSGGNVTVYSEPGRGTSFKIYLPRIDEIAPSAEQRLNQESSEIPHGTETILLAEDEDVVRKLTCEVLEMYGYRVLEAANGGSALLICERETEPIDLLLTDVVMPEMSGRELADRLLKIRPEMKILFMSGYTDNTISHQGILEEGENFIQKPFSPESLALKVREILDQ